jgi:3D (Asp-Asp-Asp) domain-containing protein
MPTPAFTGTETASAIWHKPFLLFGGTVFKTLRLFALLVVLGCGVVLAQSDDGTVLSPNLPLPNPLGLLPVGNKPQPQPVPSSVQPTPPAALVVTAPKPVATPTPASRPAASSVPVSAPRPASEPTKPEAVAKPIELPSSLILPIPSNINPAKPLVFAPPKPVAVTPKPVVVTATPKPVAVSAAPKPAPAKPPAPKAASPKPAPKPAAAPKPAPKPATVARATSSRSLLTLVAKSTAYNSIPNQTDSTPFVTATGARTRFGVVALSRDLLRRIPYGSIVRIEDMGSWANGRGRGAYNRMLSGVNFIVEDTMHPRKRNTVDVWMPTRRAAIQWGARQIRVTVIRLGRR